jgi:hypothetical protein
MAELCDSYAHAGFMDEESSSKLRQQSITIYERQLTKHAQDDETQLPFSDCPVIIMPVTLDPPAVLFTIPESPPPA